MKKELVKFAVFIGVFILSVVIMELTLNSSGEDLTANMKEASLPVCYMEADGNLINPLYGYTNEMEAIYTRDTITPLHDGLMLPVYIKTYGANVTELSYEVRTLDGSRLIENGQAEELTQEKNQIKATLNLSSLLDAGIEYQLILSLTTDGREVYYFTRIMVDKEIHSSDCVSFCLDFHEKTLDLDNEKELAKYMEPDSSVKNDNLNFVTIHSSMSQLFFADFDAEIISDVSVSVKEVKQEYCSIILSYMMARKVEGEATEYYNLEEYYRVRYGTERMYLLDYERTMNEIFKEDGDNYQANSLSLGVRSEQVDCVSSETGSIACFIQEGELWQYNKTRDSLTRVFSFRSLEGNDERENNSQHNIRAIRVDETGSMDYVVYGYMNRGIHEGQVGISVRHFDSITNASEEMVWISSDRSYEMMENIVGKMAYVNDDNKFYMMMEGSIYCIDLINKTQEIIVSGQGDSFYAVSEDGSAMAYAENGDGNQARTLYFVNMKTGVTREVSVSEDEFIKPLGFLDNDLIYGIAKSEQVSVDETGNITFPMYQVNIEDFQGNIKKTYEKKNTYVTSLYTEGYTIHLSRAKYKNGSFKKISDDTIVNMAGDKDDLISISLSSDGDKQKIVSIVLNGNLPSNDPNVLNSKEVAYVDNRDICLKDGADVKYYYSYAKGRVVAISAEAKTAVLSAALETGVVIDENGQYIWQQAKAMNVNTLSGMRAESSVSKDYVIRSLTVLLRRENVTVAVDSLLENGSTVKEIMEQTISDSLVFDLSGCNVMQMLYYVSQGRPVYAMASKNKPVLICGYTQTYLTYYDPSVNETKTVTLEAADEMFSSAGNIFLAYVVKENH